MKRRRVLLLVHVDLVPPPEAEVERLTDSQVEPFKTEYHVESELRALGHEVRVLGLYDELAPLRRAIEEFRPHVAFNLLEEFRGKATYDYYMVNYLELHRTPYTGCSAPGLFLARDKALSKKVLAYHRIRAPKFMVVPRGRAPKRRRGLEFPLIVKTLNEEASLGISQASLVHNDERLAERVAFIHRTHETAAIVEQFVPGRELYMGVIGNQRLTTFPTWELRLERKPPGQPLIATERVKWDLDYQERVGVEHGPANLPPELDRQVHTTARRIYRRLGLSGYARIDFRLHEDGRLFFLEANPNPQISADEEFAHAAAAHGLDYPQLLEKVLSLGIRRAKAW
ncbi:MAG: D-alanine--D-alanine ligase [Planctomycetota bacterium]